MFEPRRAHNLHLQGAGGGGQSPGMQGGLTLHNKGNNPLQDACTIWKKLATEKAKELGQGRAFETALRAGPGLGTRALFKTGLYKALKWSLRGL